MNSRRDFFAMSAAAMVSLAAARPALSRLAGEPPVQKSFIEELPLALALKNEIAYFRSIYLQTLFLLKNHNRIINAPKFVREFPKTKYLFLHPFGLFEILNNSEENEFVDLWTKEKDDLQHNSVWFSNKGVTVFQTTLLDPDKALAIDTAGPFENEVEYDKQLWKEAEDFNERIKSSVVAEAGGASIA